MRRRVGESGGAAGANHGELLQELAISFGICHALRVRSGDQVSKLSRGLTSAATAGVAALSGRRSGTGVTRRTCAIAEGASAGAGRCRPSTRRGDNTTFPADRRPIEVG